MRPSAKNPAQSAQINFFCFNVCISWLGFTPVSHLKLKVHSKEIPAATVPQTPQFTTNLFPPREQIATMEVLNELGSPGKDVDMPLMWNLL